MQTANKHFDAFADIDCDDTESNADHDVATCTGEFICGNIGTRSSLEHVVSDFEKQVAQRILKLREKHVLTATVQQDIIDEMQQMTSQIHDVYSSMFTTFCQEQHISSDDAASARSGWR